MNPRLVLTCSLAVLLLAALVGCSRQTETEVIDTQANAPPNVSAEGASASPDAQPAAEETASEETKALLEAKCTTCHTLERVEKESESEEEWRETVKRMQGKKPGHISDAEAEQLTQHLAAAYGEE